MSGAVTHDGPGAAEPAWQGEFHDFWPVWIVRRSLPAATTHNQALIDLALELDAGSDDLTTRYQGVDFLGIDRPAVRWLRDSIDRTIRAYFEHFEMRYDIRWVLQGWPNINRLGDYHTPHNHGWCYLSGTYYAQVPAPGAEVVDVEGAVPSGISFRDPRGGTRTGLPPDDPAAAGSVAFSPVPGTVLLWHSSLMHQVHPNLSSVPRITISFNVVLEWANHYLSGE